MLVLERNPNPATIAHLPAGATGAEWLGIQLPSGPGVHDDSVAKAGQQPHPYERGNEPDLVVLVEADLNRDILLYKPREEIAIGRASGYPIWQRRERRQGQLVPKGVEPIVDRGPSTGSLDQDQRPTQREAIHRPVDVVVADRAFNEPECRLAKGTGVAHKGIEFALNDSIADNATVHRYGRASRADSVVEPTSSGGVGAEQGGLPLELEIS